MLVAAINCGHRNTFLELGDIAELESETENSDLAEHCIQMSEAWISLAAEQEWVETLTGHVKKVPDVPQNPPAKACPSVKGRCVSPKGSRRNLWLFPARECTSQDILQSPAPTKRTAYRSCHGGEGP